MPDEVPQPDDRVRIVFGNDLPYLDRDTDPLAALEQTMATAVDDWADSRAGAWLYGIVLGWDLDEEDEGEDPDEGAMAAVAAKYGWTTDQVAHLRALHTRFAQLANASTAP